MRKASLAPSAPDSPSSGPVRRPPTGARAAQPGPQYRTGVSRLPPASAPDTEVPDSGLLPSPRRPKPYLFTPTQLTALFQAAQASRPRRSLRPHTLSTLIGLLASTGLRVGEAIRLQGEDVKLDLGPPQLHILETKFHKSRIVPLHPSTADRLHHYAERRAHLHYDALSDTFFVSERGQPLHHHALHYWFTRLCRHLAIAPTHGGRSPCLMSFRHTFAVTCMRRWYEQGQDVQALLPHLSVYLGHIRPRKVIGTSRPCRSCAERRGAAVPDVYDGRT